MLTKKHLEAVVQRIASFLVKGVITFFELYMYRVIKSVRPACVSWLWDSAGAHWWTQSESVLLFMEKDPYIRLLIPSQFLLFLK